MGGAVVNPNGDIHGHSVKLKLYAHKIVNVDTVPNRKCVHYLENIMLNLWTRKNEI